MEILFNSIKLKVFEKDKFRGDRGIVFTYTPSFEVNSLVQRYNSRVELGMGEEYKFSVKLVDSTQFMHYGQLMDEIARQVEDPSVSVVLVQFPDKNSWKQIEHIRYEIDRIYPERAESASSESSQINLIKEGKTILLLAQYGAQDFTRPNTVSHSISISYSESDWAVYAIDNLAKNDFESFISTMDLTPKQYLQLQLESDQNDIFCNLVLNAVKQLISPFLVNQDA